MEWKPLRGFQKKCDKEMEKRDMKLLRSCKKLLKKSPNELSMYEDVESDDDIRQSIFRLLVWISLR